MQIPVGVLKFEIPEFIPKLGIPFFPQIWILLLEIETEIFRKVALIFQLITSVYYQTADTPTIVFNKARNKRISLKHTE